MTSWSPRNLYDGNWFMGICFTEISVAKGLLGRFSLLCHGVEWVKAQPSMLRNTRHTGPENTSKKEFVQGTKTYFQSQNHWTKLWSYWNQSRPRKTPKFWASMWPICYPIYFFQNKIPFSFSIQPEPDAVIDCKFFQLFLHLLFFANGRLTNRRNKSWH